MMSLFGFFRAAVPSRRAVLRGRVKGTPRRQESVIDRTDPSYIAVSLPRQLGGVAEGITVGKIEVTGEVGEWLAQLQWGDSVLLAVRCARSP